MSEVNQAYSHLVRIANTDIQGDLLIEHGLSQIKGMDRRLALLICRKLEIPLDMRTGNISDDLIGDIEALLEELEEYGVPAWFHNRQRDRVTGEDLHLTGADLIFAQRQDIDYLKRLKTIRGIRHRFGLKTRGQRTRSNGRHGRTLGVSRRKEK